MRQWTVREVMTADVALVRKDTPYRKIVQLLADRQVSAVPVVDELGRVVGVVSEADLLNKIEFAGDELERQLFARRSRRAARTKAHGEVASELMTAPAITVLPDTSLVAAAKLMDGERVKRLPVVDDLGHLVGIVARRDLLKSHLRPDPEIREEVVDEVLGGTMWIDPATVEVDVIDGVVTLRGQVDRHTTAHIVVRLTDAVPGVVAVVDKLTWDFDDVADDESRFYRSHPFSTSTRQPQ